MIKHILVLMWNRKKENALIMIELAISFLVIFFLSAVAVHQWSLFHHPLGFEYADTLELQINPGGDWTEDDGKTLWQMVDTISQMETVNWVHPMSIAPFRNWSSSTSFNFEDRSESSNYARMPDEMPQDLGMQLVAGRWFDERDKGQNYDSALINQRLKQSLFGDKNPIGKNIRNLKDREGNIDPSIRELRVAGVINEFRQRGEMSELTPYVIERLSKTNFETRTNIVLIKTRPGTAISFQEELLNRAQSVAREWTLVVTPLNQLRKNQIRQVITPLTVGGLVAGFLLLMVAFGLFGVLWQNVTRRTSELGLRRALGSSRKQIFRQITGETTIITIFGLICGSLIAIQFPMLGTFQQLNWPATISGILISGILIILLTSICAIYPSWLATQQAPSDALHYE